MAHYSAHGDSHGEVHIVSHHDETSVHGGNVTFVEKIKVSMGRNGYMSMPKKTLVRFPPFGQNGRFLFATEDKVAMFDVMSRSLVWSLEVHKSDDCKEKTHIHGRRVAYMCFNHDGSRLGISMEDCRYGGVSVISPANGKRLFLVDTGHWSAGGDDCHVSHISFSHSDKRICCISSLGACTVHNVFHNEHVFRLKSDTKDFNASCFSPRDEHIVTGHANGDVSTWSFRDGSRISLWSVGSSPVFSLCFYNDGQYLVLGRSDGVALWNLKGRKVVRKFDHPSCRSVCYDGESRIVTSDGAALKVWEPDGVIHEVALESRVYSVSLTGDLLAVGMNNAVTILEELHDVQERHSFFVDDCPIFSASLSLNQKCCLTSTDEETVLYGLKSLQ